jgi:hypothetical protein
VTDLRFNQDDHTYTWGGKSVPGVTTLMQPFIGAEFKFVDPEVLRAAADLGTRAHAMIADDIKQPGTVGYETVDFDLVEYLEGWWDFRSKSGFKPILSERRVYSKKYGYAGTLDLFGELNDRLILPDIKRVTAIARSTGPQTAAYKQALIEEFPEYEKCDRAALQLLPGAKWKLHPLNDKDDLKVFLSCINIHNHIRKLT